MPELPEMENYKSLLSEKLKYKTITNVEINREKSINISPEEFNKRVHTQEIVTVERKAKHLLFFLSGGDVLLLHLMLGGWMYYGTEAEKPDRTVQVKMSFGEKNLYFIGLRLGYLHIFDKTTIKKELTNLGPEPLDPNYSLDEFVNSANEKRGRIKTTLVDKQFLSGIGNRYSDEICWHAQILPKRKMNDLQNHELIQTYQSIRYVLTQAIGYGGYMDQPLYDGDSKTGGYQSRFNVYNREGEVCNRCGTEMIKGEISSRKTFFCPGCQK